MSSSRDPAGKGQSKGIAAVCSVLPSKKAAAGEKAAVINRGATQETSGG